MSIARTVDMPAEPGLSPRAVRTVFRVYCRLADASGNFKYGIRGSKLAELAEYSLATVRRAQRYLVERGFLERVQVGGGRASTRWRIILARLGFGGEPADEPANPGHSSVGQSTQEPRQPDTAQGPARKTFTRLLGAPVGMSPAPASVCTDHGSEGGFLADGRPRCPSCRRLTSTTKHGQATRAAQSRRIAPTPRGWSGRELAR